MVWLFINVGTSLIVRNRFGCFVLRKRVQVQCVLNGVTSRWESDCPQSVWMFSVDCHRLNFFLLLVDRLCVFVQTVTCHSILSCSNLNSPYKTLIVPNLFECFLLTVRVFHCFCTGFVYLYRQRHVVPCQAAATWTVHWALRLPVCILTNHKPVHSCARCCVSEDLLATQVVIYTVTVDIADVRSPVLSPRLPTPPFKNSYFSFCFFPSHHRLFRCGTSWSLPYKWKQRKRFSWLTIRIASLT